MPLILKSEQLKFLRELPISLLIFQKRQLDACRQKAMNIQKELCMSVSRACGLISIRLWRRGGCTRAKYKYGKMIFATSYITLGRFIDSGLVRNSPVWNGIVRCVPNLITHLRNLKIYIFIYLQGALLTCSSFATSLFLH